MIFIIAVDIRCRSVSCWLYGFYCYSGLITAWVIPATGETPRCGNRTAAAVAGNAQIVDSSLLMDAGVYKSQEARLMLLVYDVQTSSTTTLTRMKEEQWSLDGFVRIQYD